MTWAARRFSSTGLERNPSAPHSKPLALVSSSVLTAEIRITGIGAVLSSPFNFRQTSYPFCSGITRSRRMTSGCSERALDRPSAPDKAVITLQPGITIFNRADRLIRLSSLSSIKSILGIPSPLTPL